MNGARRGAIIRTGRPKSSCAEPLELRNDPAGLLFSGFCGRDLKLMQPELMQPPPAAAPILNRETARVVYGFLAIAHFSLHEAGVRVLRTPLFRMEPRFRLCAARGALTLRASHRHDFIGI